MTREEAIARARKWNLGSLDEEDTTALYELIPELRESKDERTRKWIITEMKASLHDIEIMYSGDYDNRDEEDKKRQEYLNNALAYLEKQKNLDKMIVVSPEVWDNAIAEAYENGKKEGEKQKEHLTPEEKMNHPLYLEGFDIGKRVGEVTGKPAEWTDDDEQHLKWLCRIIHSRKNHGELSLTEESELGNWIDKWINHNPQPHWKPGEAQPEVDLDELINDFLLNNSEFLVERDSKAVVQKLARHFYELARQKYEK